MLDSLLAAHREQPVALLPQPVRVAEAAEASVQSELVPPSGTGAQQRADLVLVDAVAACFGGRRAVDDEVEGAAQAPCLARGHDPVERVERVAPAGQRAQPNRGAARVP